MDYSEVLSLMERPYIMLDRIVSLEPGKRARGIKAVSSNDIFLLDVPVSKRVLPDTLLLEALIQTGLSAIISHEEYKAKKVSLSGIENAKFTGNAYPGDSIVIDCEVYKLRLSTGVCKAYAYVDEKCICEASIIYGIY